jgi:hypothetical protein
MSGLLRPLSLVAACSLLLAAGAAEAAGKAPKHLAKEGGGAVEARYTDSGPEPLLAKVFDAIEANRLEVAMQQTEMLIKAYPNFRLAHLVKGDLLLARSRPLMAFGEGGGPASGEKVADLRDEAIVRLKGYRTKPPADYVPRYLLQMHPETEARGGGGHPEVAPLPLPERQRHAALRRRLLHLAGQARRRQAARGRQEDAARRLSRHRPACRARS